MGQVYRARRLDLGTTVAIKVIRPELRKDFAIVQRFLDEGRVAAGIASRHVARVIDAGHLDDRSPFLVLEFVDGPDLATVIARVSAQGSTLAPARCVAYAIDVCEGLAAAHRQGIVHRDVKPSNLLLETSASGATCVKLIDFGVAKRVVPRPLHLVTNPRVAVGSPHHMSPEQLLGTSPDSDRGSVDARTDVWSFGVVLYELLTGVLPFIGSNMLEVGTQILETDPADLARADPAIPAELGELVLRCLRKRRAHRPADASVLAFELRQIAARMAMRASSEIPPGNLRDAIGRTCSRGASSAPRDRYPRSGELDVTVPRVPARARAAHAHVALPSAGAAYRGADSARAARAMARTFSFFVARWRATAFVLALVGFATSLLFLR